jgi:hypothetical protein
MEGQSRVGVSASLDESQFHPFLTLDEAQSQRTVHQTRVHEWTSDRVARASVAKWHPVYDFLFEYYPYRAAKLKRWSPGCNVLVRDASPAEFDWSEFWKVEDGGIVIPASTFPIHRKKYLSWSIRYLSKIAERPPFFGCFGLHEWAMVYNSESLRHDYVPLRLPVEEINSIVEANDLRCSHYDAFRFFTPCAVPRNRVHLTRETTVDNDQRGCIHVTMDLYKFAHKVSPFSSSDLVSDTFLLAAKAREIDMRASPYDLTSYGFSPIRIEEKQGREEYLSLQRELAEESVPLRARLLELYSTLLAAL